MRGFAFEAVCECQCTRTLRRKRQHGNEQHVAKEVEKVEEEKRTSFARWKK